LQQTSGTDGNAARGEVEVFDYPACPGAPPLPAWDGWVEAGEGPAANGRAKGASGSASRGDSQRDSRQDFDERLAEETRKSFAAGRERGRQEGIEAGREAQTAEAERRRQQLGELVEKFDRERDRYLQEVEQEVVKLALAVAARILRREAQMDPLLLTGAVRVALGQLARSSEVRLRVPAAEVDLWTETIALVPHLTMKPEVMAEEGMRLGDCLVESKVGTVDLGIRSQLGEIERGFFDRAGSPASIKTNLGMEETDAMPLAGKAGL
jgi:flagellar assembly protein FliH